MQRLEAVQLPAACPKSTGLRAARAVARDRGISDTTLWRWGRKGWIKVHNIAGRAYIDLVSLAEFDARVAAGEFARLSGAAKRSSEVRVAKEFINQAPLIKGE